MAMNKQNVTLLVRKPDSTSAHWITSLAEQTRDTRHSAETRMRTIISCDVRASKQTLYVPPDMAALQPRSLRYLNSFARQHDLQLVEDRRRVSIQNTKDKRAGTAPVVAKALGELLKQLGMPGVARPQSSPHRLGSDSPHIDITKLVRMAAHAAPDAKRIRVQPNRTLAGVLGNNSEAINVYACKLMSADSKTVLSHFDSPKFRALGYSTGKQYVMHVCVGGGALADPELWADFHTLTRCDFRFQLLNAPDPKNDIGLLYATYYFDVAEAPAPWWLNAWADLRSSANENVHVTLLKRAS